MIWSILICIFLGTFLGIITGLTPGVHINLISLLLVTYSAKLLNILTPINIAVIITSMAVTHTFLDTIPSIFLGAPDSDTALSILPGHKMLLEGHGHQAVILTLIGSLFSLILAVSLVPFFMFFVEKIYPLIKPFIGVLLIIVSILLIYREKKNRSWALILFLLSGVFGLAVLNNNWIKEPLFPLFSGLFGTSMLVMSLLSKTSIPEQIKSKLELNNKIVLKSVYSSIVAGGICSFMPGLGPSQAAILGSQMAKDIGDKGFLILIGGLNTVNMILSFVTLYVIDKSRNGAVVSISRILDTKLTFEYFLILISAVLIVSFLATFLTINLSKIFSMLMSKVNYQKLCITIIGLIVILVTIISGWLGLFVLLIATLIGIIPGIKNIGRNHLIGPLLLSVILYFMN